MILYNWEINNSDTKKVRAIASFSLVKGINFLRFESQKMPANIQACTNTNKKKTLGFN